MEVSSLDLADLGDDVRQAFLDEVPGVVKNIADKAKGEGKREIIIKVTLDPNPARDRCKTSINRTVKLAGAKPLDSAIFIDGHEEEKLVVTEEKRQLNLPG